MQHAVAPPPNWVLCLQAELQKTLQLYGQVVNMWRNMMDAAGELEYAQASYLLGNLESLSGAFKVGHCSTAQLTHAGL
jgi:hypothetical protein